MSANSPKPKRFPSPGGKTLLDETLDFGTEVVQPVPSSDIKRLESILKQIEDISARIDKLANEV